MANAQFFLHHYPKQEDLADLLLNKVQKESLGSAFHRSHVLVRNQGMATWLKRRLAQREGIAMQVEFPQPNAFLQSILRQDGIAPEQLTWRIYQAIPKLLDQPHFQFIRRYLKHSTSATESDLKRYQLSGIIAGLFDKYMLYRPEWILSWENNERPQYLPGTPHESWQRELWQTISHHSQQHWSQSLLEDSPVELPDASLRSLHVFGISNFAPIYVQFLYRISEQIPVHIYWMNPVEAHGGYWEDAPSRQQWTLAAAYDDPETLMHNNPLLASFGRLGREFVHTLYGGKRGELQVQEESCTELQDVFPSPVIAQAQTRLQRLQSSLYNNKPNQTGANQEQPDPEDLSISIHSCHTSLRELETLKGYLLRLAEQSSLDSSDVLVMCPDIASYAPAIEAVFGEPSSGQPSATPAIPFTVGDSHTPCAEPAIAAVIQLFSLHTSRFTNHDALSLLSTTAIRQKHELGEDDLVTLRDWIVSNGIRWGFDQNHVQRLTPDCPDVPWSWQEGIKRMLLGLAMPQGSSGTPVIWQGILPFHDIEGHDSRLLGSLCQFFEWCHGISKDLQQPRTLTQWVKTTHQWIDTGFQKDAESQQQLQALYQTLDNILLQADDSEAPLPAEVFSEHLNKELENNQSPKGFLNGAVTFCEMKPMRAIPSRIICLLGMNHDQFPRQSSDVPFDLTQLQREMGDRSTRDDDTYSFLEALLSAREALFISYIGNSIKDGQERPPSTALQTLIDYEPELKSCIKQEKLHSFDPYYFSASEPISHDSKLREAAQAMLEPSSSSSAKPALKIDGILEPPIVPVDTWIHTIIHPARHFLKHSLQARSLYKKTPLEGNEPIDLDHLVGYQFRLDLLQSRQLSPQQIEAWKQQGQLPCGALGESVIKDQFTTLLQQLEDVPLPVWTEIKVTIDDSTKGTERKPLSVMGHIPSVEIENVQHAIIIDPSSAKAATRLRLWIYQLLLSAHYQQPAPAILYYVKKGRFEVEHINGPENYLQLLQQLNAISRKAHSEPVPHFAKTAYAYTQKKPGKNQSPEEHAKSKIVEAQKEWQGSQYNSAEMDDEALHYLFDTSQLFIDDAFTDDFIHTAELIWNPLLKQMAK